MSLSRAIEVQGVGRVFRSVQRQPGFKGAVDLILRPTYQSHTALKDVSFSIEPGAFVGLIGANGAGKTTLLKILSGLIPPTTGRARVLGYEPFTRPLNFRRQIALVMGQKAQLWWDLPALDAFELIRAMYEIPRPVYRERLDKLTALLDVEKLLHTQIRRLSLGERMKMELIGALLNWPKVVFLDEPTIGLDVLAAHNLREFLKAFNREQGATIILTSHNMDDIERLCSRVMILRTGEMLYDGAPGGLIREGECQLRVRLMESPLVEDLGQVAEVAAAAIRKGDDDEGGVAPYFLTLSRERVVETLQKLFAKYRVIDMGIEEQSLESAIQRVFEKGVTAPAQGAP